MTVRWNVFLFGYIVRGLSLWPQTLTLLITSNIYKVQFSYMVYIFKHLEDSKIDHHITFTPWRQIPGTWWFSNTFCYDKNQHICLFATIGRRASFTNNLLLKLIISIYYRTYFPPCVAMMLVEGRSVVKVLEAIIMRERLSLWSSCCRYCLCLLLTWIITL